MHVDQVRTPISEGEEHRGSAELIARPAGLEMHATASVGATAPRSLTPAGLLALQRSAGNRAVARAIAANRVSFHPGRRVLARSKKSDFTASAEDLEHLRTTMQQLVKDLDSKSRLSLVEDRTLAIGLVVDDDGDPHVVYTTSQDWTTQALRDAADAQGVHRWEGKPDVKGRNEIVGAPGDAEQLMMQFAHYHHFRIAAMAVSRPPCPDCSEAIQHYDEGTIQVVVERPMLTEAEAAIKKKVDALWRELSKLKKQVDLVEGEHQSQRDLIDKPSVTGFAGYVVDKFNKYPLPQMAIWLNAHAMMTATRGALYRRNPEAALGAYLQARRSYLIALKQFSAWKNGLDAAATRTKIAIGVVAGAAIAAFVAPAAIAAAAEWLGAGAAAGTAGAAAGEQQTLIRIADLVTKADEAMAAADAVTEEQLMAEAELQAEREAAVRLVAEP